MPGGGGPSDEGHRALQLATFKTDGSGTAGYELACLDLGM